MFKNPILEVLFITTISIRNGRIVDGSGNPWYRSNLVIEKGKIVSIDNTVNIDTEICIDANGLVVAPGFIDVHSHCDFTNLQYRKMENVIVQGITTVITGNCGISFAPVNPSRLEELEEQFNLWNSSNEKLVVTWYSFDEYLKEEEKSGLGVNTAHLIGHNTIRASAMGMENREPSYDELELMKQYISKAMESGAFGLSTGLVYPPGVYAKTEEIIELAKVTARYNGVYASHIRGEGDNLLQAVKEAITIGEKARLPVQISHHKVSGKQNWGKSIESLKLMEEARGQGVDVTFDQYPYNAGSTSLVSLLPFWVHEGGIKKVLERLQEEKIRHRIKTELEKRILSVGWANIYVSYIKSKVNKKFEGKHLLEINELRRDSDLFTTLFNLIIEENGTPNMVTFTMDDEEVSAIMQHPLQMIGTDAEACSTSGSFSLGKPHPRHYGTYPRILGKYVRDEGNLRLEEAIRKMTSFPAQRFGLLDHGLIRPGMVANLTIFDPNNVIDKATYEKPHQFPEGIKYVIINGQVVVEDGKPKGLLAGKTLRKN